MDKLFSMRAFVATARAQSLKKAAEELGVSMRSISRAVMELEIRALLDEHLATTVPSGLLGKALHYLAGQWPKLNRYIEDAAWPIDNNPCENAIRPFVVGRRYRQLVVIAGSTPWGQL